MGVYLQMLGGFTLRDASCQLVELPTRKTKALLAYLAVHAGEPQTRDCLMTLLWGDRRTRNARHSLNQALVSIRRLDAGAGMSLLESRAETITLRRPSLESDLDLFRKTVVGDPERAVALYDGDFLWGLTISSDEFERWAADISAEIRERFCEALERAAQLAVQTGNHGRGLTHARRLVKLDPLRESGHRCLIQLLHRMGKSHAALQQYRICADALEKDLGVTPSADLQRVAEQIRRDGRETARCNAGSTVAMCRARTVLAFLPFEVPAGDAASAQLADGIAVDLATELTRFRWFEVLACGSDRRGTGTTDDLRFLEELGASYWVNAKVRRSDRCLSVSVQLLNVDRGGCVWAQRFSRWLEDDVTLQETLACAIAAQLEPALAEAEHRRARLVASVDTDVWRHYQQGMSFAGHTGEYFKRAKPQFAAAIELDPCFSPALAALSHVYSREVVDGMSDDCTAAKFAAIDLSQRAVNADAQNPYAHYARGRALMLTFDIAPAQSAFQTALRLCPSSALPHEGLAKLLTTIGRPEEAIRHLKQALLMSPDHPRRRVMAWEMGRAWFALGNYHNAVKWLDMSTAIAESWYVHLSRAQALVQLKRREEAGDALAAARRCVPVLSPEWLESHRRAFPFVPATRRVRAIKQAALRRLGFYD